MSEFEEFPKIARLSREIIITEKIDGTNAQIYIYRSSDNDNLSIKSGSRSKWITPEDDNYGFAKWVENHKEELIIGLGEGRHFGEWWGSGVQRNYGLKEKRFSLFNTHRWGDDATRPVCCHVVPVIWNGVFDTAQIDNVLAEMIRAGSYAAPGFMNPEGIIIYHKASNNLFKKTIEKDDEWKRK